MLEAQTNTSVLANGTWFKISVSETGIYKISYSDLLNMGINPGSVNPKTIRLYGNKAGMLPQLNSRPRPDDLQELAIKVIGEDDNFFNTGDYILFYGQSPVVWNFNQSTNNFEHTMNLYSDKNFYFLNFNNDYGKRVQSRVSLNVTPAETVNTFDDYQFHELEKYNFIKSGKDWYGEKFDTVLTYNFSYNFLNLAQTEPLSLKILLAGRSSVVSNFSLNVNGQALTPVSIPTTNLSSSTGSYAYVVSKTNSFNTTSDFLNFSLTYNKPLPTSIGWLDYFEINAKRNLVMTGDQMCFRNKGGWGQGKISKYVVTTDPAITEIWDVTDVVNARQQLVELPVLANTFSFVVNADTLREFIAFHYTNFKTPVFSGTVTNQNIHGLISTNLLIVTDELFLGNANMLAEFHRSHDNLSVHVITTKQIYNEFSTGSQDISAIRNFAKMIYFKGIGTSDELRYLLLFGDASYDYKNRIPNNTNFVPTFESTNSLDPTGSFLCDDYFTLFDSIEGNVGGFESMDIGVGRLPVKNTTEANAVVQKIIRYASDPASLGAWRTDICFIGDDAEDVTQHQRQANDLANMVDTMQPCYNINKIFLDDYVQISDSSGASYPSVNTAINKQIENGALIMNYTGHGNENGLANEHILTLPMIESWSNINKLPLFMTATCEFGRFDNPAVTSAAELIFLHPNGGGIAMMTTPRLVYSTPNYYLNLSFINNVFSLNQDGEHYRLGDLIRLTKNDPMNAGTNKRSFTLLGDPALMLSYPKYGIFATQINGINSQNFTDTLYPGEVITISGQVKDDAGLVMTGFNGNIHYRLFDKERTDTTHGNDGNQLMVFHRQDSILLEGDAIVTNGIFDISMTIPGNMGPGFGKPKFSFYADNQIYDAMGCFDDVEVYGWMAGLDENTTGEILISLYPTVTTGLLYCESENTDFSKMAITVSDLSGRAVSLNSINKTGNYQSVIDVSNLEIGLYFIRFADGNKSVTKKIIKN